jgi:hypothetical protein
LVKLELARPDGEAPPDLFCLAAVTAAATLTLERSSRRRRRQISALHCRRSPIAEMRTAGSSATRHVRQIVTEYLTRIGIFTKTSCTRRSPSTVRR